MQQMPNVPAPGITKDPRPGSKAHIDVLKPRLNEILEWEAKINQAKGKEAQALRAEFKNTFGTSFTLSLIEKLSGKINVAVDQEPLNQDPSQVLAQCAAQINNIIVSDRDIEDNEAILQGIQQNPDYLAMSSEMDKEREELEADIINQAAALVGPENTNEREEQKSSNSQSELYTASVRESFEKLSLSPKDLETIPGLTNLPESVQLMIATGLQAMALEQAKEVVKEIEAKKMENKGFFGRLGQGISSAFKSKGLHQEALTKQSLGGLEKHGVNLMRMVDWAQTFIPTETKNQKGEKQIDFMDSSSLSPDLQNNETLKQSLSEFNQVAVELAALPKHDVMKIGTKAKGSLEKDKEQKYLMAEDRYNLKQKDLRKKLLEAGMHPKEAELYLFRADAKVNMLQFLSADPNLEKEWTAMLQKESAFKSFFKSTGQYLSDKENLKSMAFGFGTRLGFKSVFISTMGTAAGLAAIPVAALAIGAWRGKERAKKQLKAKDRFVDKKQLTTNPILVQRTAALQKMQSMLPLYSELGQNKPGRVSYEEWAETASQRKIGEYKELKMEFDKLSKDWEKVENKNVDQKVLKSQDLSSKIELLLSQIKTANTEEEYKTLLGSLQRRLDFTKNLADQGLVNFGDITDRTDNMSIFYNTLHQAQFYTINFDYNSPESYEVKSDIEGEGNIRVEVQKRAERLIHYFENKAGEKLEEHRKKYIINGLKKGAGMAFIFSGLGVGISELVHFPGAASDSMETAVANASRASAETVTEEAMLTSSQDAVTNAAEAVGNTSEEIISDAPSAWSNEITNEGLNAGQSDSVWRSTREIFLQKANDLGYQGDEAGLNKWAEIQTNRALANSGDITDKVFTGNQVILEKSGDSFFVSVEQGDGLSPNYLSELRAEEIPLGDTEAVETPTVDPDLVKVDRHELLRKVEEAYSLSSSEIFMADNGQDNVVVTVIGGHEVQLNLGSDQYYLIDANGDAVLGKLPAPVEGVAINLKDFLAQQLNLVCIDDLGDEAVSNVETVIEQTGGNTLLVGQLFPGVGEAGKRLWNSLNEADKLNELHNFFKTTTGAKISARANNIGIMISTNSSLPVERVSTDAIKQFSEATGIKNLAENITLTEKEELNKVIGFINANGYSASHGSKLANFAAKLIYSRGKIGL